MYRKFSNLLNQILWIWSIFWSLGRHELHIHVHCPWNLSDLFPGGLESEGKPLATTGPSSVGAGILLSVYIHDASQKDLHHYIKPGRKYQTPLIEPRPLHLLPCTTCMLQTYSHTISIPTLHKRPETICKYKIWVINFFFNEIFLYNHEAIWIIHGDTVKNNTALYLFSSPKQ